MYQHPVVRGSLKSPFLHYQLESEGYEHPLEPFGRLRPTVGVGDRTYHWLPFFTEVSTTICLLLPVLSAMKVWHQILRDLGVRIITFGALELVIIVYSWIQASDRRLCCAMQVEDL